MVGYPGHGRDSALADRAPRSAPQLISLPTLKKHAASDLCGHGMMAVPISLQPAGPVIRNEGTGRRWLQVRRGQLEAGLTTKFGTVRRRKLLMSRTAGEVGHSHLAGGKIEAYAAVASA
jgi:hypothetical protein